jgi:hypothetical protein
MRFTQAIIFLLFQSLIWTFCAKVISQIFNHCEPILRGKTFGVQKKKMKLIKERERETNKKVFNKNVFGLEKTKHKMNIQIAKKERERKRKKKTDKERKRQIKR